MTDRLQDQLRWEIEEHDIGFRVACCRLHCPEACAHRPLVQLRFVPLTVAAGGVTLGEISTVATLLVCDIRNFVHPSEKRAPGDVVEILNTCFARMSDVIPRDGGMIDSGSAHFTVMTVAPFQPFGGASRMNA